MKIQKLVFISFLVIIFLSGIASAGMLKIRETVKDFSFSQDNSLTVVNDQSLIIGLSDTVLEANNKSVYIKGNTLAIEENFNGWYSEPINVLSFDSEEKFNNYYFSIEIEPKFTVKAEDSFGYSKNGDAWVFINNIGLAGIHQKGRASLNLNFLGLAIGSVVYSLKMIPEEKELTQSNFDSGF